MLGAESDDEAEDEDEHAFGDILFPQLVDTLNVSGEDWCGDDRIGYSVEEWNRARYTIE